MGTGRVPGRAAEFMPRDLLRAEAKDDARVLQPPVRIEQLGPHGADGGLQRQGDHGLQPVRLDHQDVVVDERQERARGSRGGGVVQGAEVEGGVDPQDLHARRLLQPGQQVEGVRRAAAVVDDAQFQGRIVGLLEQARDAGFQQARPVARGDDRQHLGQRFGQGALDSQPAPRAGGDRRLHACPLQVAVDRLQPRPVGLAGGALRHGPGAGIDPPVIQDVRDVDDAPGACLDDAQREVMVLGAVEPLAQSPKPPQQVQPRGERMVLIVLRQQALAVEVRLEQRRGTPASRIDAVLVGVDRDGVGMGGEGPADHRQGVGRQKIVVVEKDGDVSLGQRHGGVGRGGHAPGAVVTNQTHARIGGRPIENAPHLGRDRAVVGDAQAPAAVGLAHDGIDGGLQMLGPRVMHRHQDRHGRQLGVTRGPGSHSVQFGSAGFVAQAPQSVGRG